MEMRGFFGLTMVDAVPINMKSAPAALTSAERSITCW
jgi:hypothetical protein